MRWGSAFAVLGAALASALAGQVTRVGGEFQVNSYTSFAQSGPAVAISGSGGAFVVVWTGDRDGGATNLDILTQRFGPSGAPLSGELLVNTFTSGNQNYPAVAASFGGDFVVTWQSFAQDGSTLGVFARRWSAAGVPQASEFQVNVYTTSDQRQPTVAMSPAGDFVIAWQSFHQDGEYWGMFARRFASSGTPIAVEFHVNQQAVYVQSSPAVAMDAQGNFVITWQTLAPPPNFQDVHARLFDSAGNAVTDEFQVNSYTSNSQQNPSVAFAGTGDFVVAWESFGQDGDGYGIVARRFDASGTPLGGEFVVNTFGYNHQRLPEVRADGDADFVVAWQSQHQEVVGTDPGGIFARRFDSSGAALTTELHVNTYTTSTQGAPAIGMAPGGNFVIGWSSLGQDGSLEGVFAQRFAVLPKVFDIDGNGAVEALTDGLLFLRYFFGFRGTTLVSGAVALNCSRCTPVPIESYLAGLAAVASAKKSGPEFQVNSYTPGDQRAAAAAADADGSFVVAWHSAHDGSGLGIFARRFDQNGAPLTGELQVNQYVAGAQNYPQVAMDANGDFVVAWQSDGQDGSGLGIFARGFNSAGVPKATEFQVNSSTVDVQQRPAIAMNPNGDFVIAWGSYPQYAYPDVFARRFNAALTPLATEFRVNATIDLSQTSPAVAMLSNGAFVVAWRFYGIWARRYDAAGVALASEFKVNTFSNELQTDPDVAVDSAGGFVVTWQSENQDGNLFGVSARRFDSAGVAQGGEFQVNAFTIGNQGAAVVRSIGSGEFVITWTSDGQDGSANGVFARRYDSAGAPQATELQVNKLTAGSQAVSTLAMDASGDFVAAWHSAAQDGSGYGIFGQRFKVGRTADIDGDGVVGPLTDGLLFLRYAFGFRDASLVSGAVGPNCTRCSAVAIESYIAGKD